MTIALILAGGLGTRLRSAVSDVPKPMADICGRPFLEYLMTYWIGQGVSKFVLSVGYMSESIVNHFGNSFRCVPIEYLVETEPLGTGGALLSASRYLEEPFLLLNGDTFFDLKLSTLLEFHRTKKSKLSFALFRANEADRYGGVVKDSSGRIEQLVSNKGKVGALANAGVYIVDPAVVKTDEFVSKKKYSLEEDLIPFLLKSGCPMFGIECIGEFIDIGVPRDYFRAAEILNSSKLLS